MTTFASMPMPHEDQCGPYLRVTDSGTLLIRRRGQRTRLGGVLVNGVYKLNPTARNIADLVSPTGKIGSSRMNGQFMYVVDDSGNIIIGTRAGKRMPHPTLIGGSNPTVQAAGIVEIRGGRIYSVNNASGHYKPGPGSLDVAERAFSNLPSGAFHKDFKGFIPFQ